MALINCQECKKEVSQKAGKCPNCGAPIKKPTSTITWIVAIFLGLWIFNIFSESPDKVDQYTKSATDKASAGYVPSNDDSKPDATKKSYKLGETAHVGYTSYAAWKAYYVDKLSDNQYLDRPADANYLFIDLTVRNNDSKARSIAPFKLVDERGNEYETSNKAWGVENSIGVLDSLNPEVQKEGLIVFDVPKGKDYKLKISGGYWSSDEAFIDLGLK